MPSALKKWLRAMPLVLPAKRLLDRLIERNLRGEETTLNVVHAFPLFAPYFHGNYPLRARLTLQSVNGTVPGLNALAAAAGLRPAPVRPIRAFAATDAAMAAALALKERLDHHGSDKANHHDYHFVYGPILADRARVRAVVEIGIGTNHTDMASNMGTLGRPGASLRAFRDYLPNALVTGADIDRRILFTDDRITTHFVDQTDPATLAALGEKIPAAVDLFIDDGLHSPSANLETLAFALGRAPVGGWVVVEDIAHEALPVWQFVSAILPPRFETHLLRSWNTLVVAVRRVS